jgi:hypothetical protein
LNTVYLKGNRDSIKALPRKEVATPKGEGTRIRIEEREKKILDIGLYSVGNEG